MRKPVRRISERFENAAGAGLLVLMIGSVAATFLALGGWDHLIRSAVGAAVVFALFSSFGSLALHRLAWKEEPRLDESEQRPAPLPAPVLKAEPLPGPPDPAPPPPELTGEAAAVLADLLVLGRNKRDAISASGFLGAGMTRTRALGEKLEALGGQDHMKRACDHVERALSAEAARELRHAWDGIGDWTA